ncbi:hypothetical protein [Nocardioides sp. 503]|uniref:hypothetical protein n=1 Tax=Nocardioides sp. 503 TaxID=2508326 RepID=UPI00106FD191|nr:hypothetical protein [Nocardioides sp. 503]
MPRRTLRSALVVLTSAAAVLAATTAVPAPSWSAPADDAARSGPGASRAGARAVVGLRTARQVSSQRGARAVVTVTRAAGRVPAGRVVLRSGTRVLASVTTRAGRRARVVLDLPRLRPGQHRVRAYFRAGGRRLGRSPAVAVTSRAGCAWKPSACGFASAGTTGVPRGTRLRASGSVTVTRPGTVIDGLDIRGTLTIKAPRVVVRNTRIRGAGFWVVTVDKAASGVVLQDVEVDGLGTRGVAGSSGIVGGSPTIIGARVTGVENGLVPGSGTRIRRSYVHGLASPGAPHYDGIQIDGGVKDISVTASTIDVSDQTQTSAVMIDNYFGAVSDVSVTRNLLMGGGFTVYADGAFSDSDGIETVTYARNRLVRGYYGYHLVRNARVRWAGNVVDRTGSPVRVPASS